jgi:hypothetical protein
MNPYMTCFAVLGFLYLVILVWATVSWLPGSIGIGVFGIILCASGWWYSKENLS